MPTHAWLVHAPIGLSIGVPCVLFACAWLARQRPAAWWLAVVASAALAVSALVASNAGESEVPRYHGVPRMERAIEAHEDAADRLTWAACALAVLVLVAAAVKKERARLAAHLACAVLSLGLLVLSWDAGHAGGALVWRWDAPSVRAKD